MAVSVHLPESSARAGSAVRAALLDAAAQAVCAGNWSAVRMADVAAAAAVSRQTLYNEFGDKDGLVRALALREADRFIAVTEQVLSDSRPGGPAAAVAAAVEATLNQAADNPLLKAVLTDDVGGLLPYLTTRAERILDAARTSIQTYLQAEWPSLAGEEVELAAEAVVRLTVSYLVLPSDARDASASAVAGRVARVVARLLEPAGGSNGQ